VKVCFVLPSLAGGGAERVAVTVLSALDPAKYERVLYLFSGEGVYFDRLDPGVQVVIGGGASWTARLRRLTAFLHDTQPQIVMPFLSYFITAIAAAFSGSRARVVFNQGTPTTGFLDDPDFKWRQPWRRALFGMVTRLFYRRADAVVVTSKGVATDLIETYSIPPQQIRVLHNPVDLVAIASAAESAAGDVRPADRPVIVTAGRLARVKNYPLLLEAAAIVLRQRPAHVWILGEGEERASLERAASVPPLSGHVTFVGFQSSPWPWIARADVFVLTSVYEGFGNVLIEAMACGTPVVATRSPGTVEIIEDGVNGLLVDHTAEAVATAIARLLEDGGLRQRLIARAADDVRHYAAPAVAARYQRLFEELVA
jgi:glycosyltransferase involved in cell wall biosynthesis